MQKLKQRLQHKRIFGMGGILAGILAFTGTVYGAPEEMPEENQVAYAEVSTCLNIREGAGMEYPVIARLPKDGYCEVKKEEGAWCYIESEEIEGYVYKSYLETGMNQETYLRRTGREEPVYAYKVENVEMNTAGKGQEIADFALQFVGNPYVWGGTSLTSGADCSGFTQAVYAHFGITTGRSSRDQAARGKEIPVDEAQPGDLLFYASGSYINHVAMYIGGGQVIHASNPKTGICISPSNYRTPCKAVTFLD